MTTELSFGYHVFPIYTVTDDILDAAQKAINDAAKSAGLPPDPQPPQPTAPAAPEPTPAPPAPQPANAEPVENNSPEPKNPESVIVPPEHHGPHQTITKKPSKGPLIALIALLLLILPVSVYFISQQNQQLADIRSKAAWDTVYQGCTVNPDSCGEGFTCHCQNGNACTYTLCEPNSQTKNSCERQGRAWCINGYNGNAYTCCYPGYQCGANNTGCYEVGDDDNGDDDDTTATPTPTTGNAPVCLNIKLYKDGTQVADLTSLRPGDVVVLAVRGNLNPTKAHFRVNGGAWNETTTKNASDEFTWNYTIADGVTDFVIEGEVFTNGAWH